MDETEVELEICVARDDAGYGFSITGVTTFSVSKVAENGAAERAGLKINDVIRRINGQIPKGSNKVVHKMITGKYDAHCNFLLHQCMLTFAFVFSGKSGGSGSLAETTEASRE